MHALLLKSLRRRPIMLPRGKSPQDFSESFADFITPESRIQRILLPWTTFPRDYLLFLPRHHLRVTLAFKMANQ